MFYFETAINLKKATQPGYILKSKRREIGVIKEVLANSNLKKEA
jgi:hypothetical protein